jgi:hypothetical protein
VIILVKSNKELRKEGLQEKRTNQLFQIINNSYISDYDKNLLKKEVEEGLISDKNVLKQKIKEKPKKSDKSIENHKSNTYNKSKRFNHSNEYKKQKKYRRSAEYNASNKYKNYKILKPIDMTDKNYKNGLNRQDSIFGVRISDLVARDEIEKQIYDELNESLARNTYSKTWNILKRALKKYYDNPIFLYYKSLVLYHGKNFSYADDCVSKAKSYAIRYGLSDNFIYKCDELLNNKEVRREVSTIKRPKRPSRRVYKNNKAY